MRLLLMNFSQMCALDGKVFFSAQYLENELTEFH